MSSKTVYMPPEAKIITLKDFDLSKIEETFAYASFERKVSKQKVHKIAHAIIENKFTDNVLRLVHSSGPSKYDVIDGQHRIEGLKYARDFWALASYDLILFVYTGGNSREIYRRLNLGKPLTLADHLKALDSGKIRFFNELREYCEHYMKGSKMRYAVAINCLHYAKSTSIRPLRPMQIDDFLQSIISQDITSLKKFIPLLSKIATNPESIFYHYTVMRNFFRIYYENEIAEDGMIALGDELVKSEKIRELAEKRDNHAMRGIYHYIIDVAGPKVSLQLEKGIVKDKE